MENILPIIIIVLISIVILLILWFRPKNSNDELLKKIDSL